MTQCFDCNDGPCYMNCGPVSIPTMTCQNCGFVAEKTRIDNPAKQVVFGIPHDWGYCCVESENGTVSFNDLCPECARAAWFAIDKALKKRGKKEKH